MDNLLYDDHLLLKFSPRLRSNIKELWMDGKVGISSKTMKIRTSNSKNQRDDYTGSYNDSFVLEVPYAAKVLLWEVIFKAENYDYPPDFDFLNDTFLSDPDVNIIANHIPTLDNWDVDNPKCLISVIREFLNLYKKFQVMKLQTDNKYAWLYNKYEVLMAEMTSDNTVEVFIDNSGAVHFLISVNVDFSCLPPYIQPILFGKATHILNPHEDAAFLKITYVKPDGSKIHCELQSSPRLEQVIGNSSALHIPVINKEANINEYVTQITKLIRDKVQQIANHYTLKNQYISVLLSACGASILEYDNTLFSKATLLFQVNGFYTIVSVTIGNKFPQEPPKITLRSVYLIHREKAFVHNCENCPYSPRWKVDEMITRLLNFLHEEIPTFQAICHKLLEA